MCVSAINVYRSPVVCWRYANENFVWTTVARKTRDIFRTCSWTTTQISGFQWANSTFSIAVHVVNATSYTAVRSTRSARSAFGGGGGGGGDDGRPVRQWRRRCPQTFRAVCQRQTCSPAVPRWQSSYSPIVRVCRFRLNRVALSGSVCPFVSKTTACHRRRSDAAYHVSAGQRRTPSPPLTRLRAQSRTPAPPPSTPPNRPAGRPPTPTSSIRRKVRAATMAGPLSLFLQTLLCAAALRPTAIYVRGQDTDSLASSFFSGNSNIGTGCEPI